MSLKTKLLNENKELYKGLFWIKDLKNISSCDTYFPIPCDEYGNCSNTSSYQSGMAKSNNTLNHKKLWDTLPSKITDNKSFDYYPRGRVEIHNGKAKIFIPISLIDYQDEIKSFAIKRFNLISYNGIKEIIIIPDASEHYRPKMQF